MNSSHSKDEFPVTKRQKLESTELQDETPTEKYDASVEVEENVSYDEINEKDLPLLANIDQVRVCHYLLNLRFDMNRKIVYGSEVLFLQWKGEKSSTHDSFSKNSSQASSSGFKNSKSTRMEKHRIILDCCFLKVHKVDLLCRETKKCGKDSLKETPTLKQFCWFTKPEISNLNFTLEKWSLNIDVSSEIDELPSVIRIHYETSPNTPSLHWRPSIGFNYNDESQNVKSVYTPASPVNNRGLFPCQEPPCAMATWECLVELDKCENYQALLSSDNPGIPLQHPSEIEIPSDVSSYYFNCSMILPMSTFALSIGTFATNIYDFVETEKSDLKTENTENSMNCGKHEEYPCRIQSHANDILIPVRLFSFSDYFSIDSSYVDIKELLVFVKNVLTSAYHTLGPHPFSRLDLVIMPQCFPSLGLANPNMIFLSPSVFYGSRFDSYSCFSRISHEIAHSWFGLLIGALDWTEEWLSEGFATYMEDILYKQAACTMTMTVNDSTTNVEHETFLREQLSLKAVLRAINLRNELNATESDNQILSHCNPTDVKTPNSSVKNGLVPEKQFMQVHYLKGYFFLKHLCDIVGGEDKFLVFLKSYIQHFHGQLVTSHIFLQYFQHFFGDSEELKGKDFKRVEVLKFKWLQDTNLQEPLKSVELIKLNIPVTPTPISTDCCEKNVEIFSVFPDCKNPVLKCMNAVAMCHDNENFDFMKKLTSIELVYSLENILLEVGDKFSRKFCIKLLKSLGLLATAKSTMRNFVSDVLHCFCELIVQIRSTKSLNIVEKFLLEHPAMGVYLYGELMISEKKAFQDAAIRLFNEQKCVLDPSVLKVLEEMLF